MIINNQDQEAVQNVLARVYGILKFSPDDAKSAINDLKGIQQLAVSTELLKSMSEAEVAALSDGLVGKTEAERKTMVEEIAKTYSANEDFNLRAQTEVKKVLDDHIAYLKTRGDASQQAEIAGVLAQLG